MNITPRKSAVDTAEPDIAEDRQRLDAFKRTRVGVPLEEIKNWVES